MSNLFRDALAPEHLLDLRKSGLSDASIRAHFVRTVPPWMIAGLLGYDLSHVRSALLFPFRSPNGGFMRHVRMKMFWDVDHEAPKYLQPAGTTPRLYFTAAALSSLACSESLWLVEGEKKALAVSQFGIPAIAFSGIHGWHTRGSRHLLPDFDFINLDNRVVELVPDGDCKTNKRVERGAMSLALALRARGANVRLVELPSELRIHGKSGH